MAKLIGNIIFISFSFIFFETTQANSNKLKYNLVSGLPDIYISPNTEKIGHTWSNGHVWEKHLIHKFYSLLNTHNAFFVAFDLGAQTGCFSLLAKYFPNSTWYAFEPIQEAVSMLLENLSLNNITNVHVHQKAAADFTGETILRMPAMHAWGLSTIGSNVQRFQTVIERKIECIDLDSFVVANNIPKVHFMKLDTEGSELYILRGAKNMILRDHPIILMEYNEINMKQCNVTKKDVDDFLKELGYEWKLISSEDILCAPITM